MNKDKKVIQHYITSVFLLQVIAKGVTLLTLWIFRFFGMPELWEWYRMLEHPGRIRFYIVLSICTVCTIWKIKKRT